MATLAKRIALWLATSTFAIGHAPTVVSAGALPPWLVLKPGAVAYLDAEGDKSTPAGRRVVCKDRNAYVRHGVDDDILLEPVGTSKRGCFVRRAYGRVRVERIVAYGAIGRARAPIVAITSRSGGWSGVVLGLALLPIVPRGAKFKQHRGSTFFRSRAIVFDRRNAPSNGYTIERSTEVEVLHQNPPDAEHNDLYVRVLTGPQRGELAWTTLFLPGTSMQDASLDSSHVSGQRTRPNR